MRVVQLFGREADSAARFAAAQPGASGGAPPLDHDLRRFLPSGGAADRRSHGAAAVLRRTSRHRRYPYGWCAGGLYPAHPPLFPAAPGSLGEVQSAAECHGLVRAGVRPAGPAGDGAGAGPSGAPGAAGAGRGPLRRGLVSIQPRGALGAARCLVHGLARADHRAGGPYRSGQDHDSQSPAPLLRSGPGPDPDRRGGHQAAVHLGSPVPHRFRAAGPVSVCRRHSAQPDPRRPDSTGGGPTGGAPGGGRPVHRAAARPGTTTAWASGVGV